jgi:LysM repeat protein/soluble cytochrome b562
MIVSTTHPYDQDKRFWIAQENFQRGEWGPGLVQLDELTEAYPQEPDLRSLRNEMALRARIDQDELDDQKAARKFRLRKIALYFAGVFVVILLAYWGLRTYSAWFKERIAFTNQKVESQLLVLDLAFKSNNIKELLKAGRLAEAQKLVEEIAKQDPNYSGLSELRASIGIEAALQSQYDQAVQLATEGKLQEALAAFQEIVIQEPYYKDTQLQITDIEKKLLLANLLTQADEAFKAKQWDEAASGYETIRAVNAEYQPDYIEKALFDSYMNAAQKILEDKDVTLEALEAADVRFRKALAMRPQDAEIQSKRLAARESIKVRLVNSYFDAAEKALTEQPDSLQAIKVAESYFQKALEIDPENEKVSIYNQMASYYLEAQDLFNQGSWDDVIVDLEYIYAEDPGYADGTSRQTLYEAYMSRGNGRSASGSYESALSDYKRAAELAVQDPNATIPLLEAQVKISETLGILGDNQEAVTIYQALFDLGCLSKSVENDPNLVSKLSYAQRSAELHYYQTAYRYFREVANAILKRYLMISVEVKSGDYLTQLANQYDTTVGAILLANEDINPKDISPGDVINIPTLP